LLAPSPLPGTSELWNVRSNQFTGPMPALNDRSHFPGLYEVNFKKNRLTGKALDFRNFTSQTGKPMEQYEVSRRWQWAV